MENIHENKVGEVLSYEQCSPYQSVTQPRSQDLSMEKTLAAAGHMPRR
jgi:hypothetical protein